MNLLTSRELTALFDSSVIAISTAILATCIGLLISLASTHLSHSKQQLLSIFLFLTLLIAPFFHALVWQNTIQAFIRLNVLTFEHLNLLRSNVGITLILTISFTPIAFFLIFSSLTSIPKQLIDAGKLYLDKDVLLSKIILPQLKPAIMSSAVLIFLLTFNNFDVPGFYEKNTFITEIFSQFSAHYDVNRAVLLSLIPVTMTLFGISFIFQLLKSQPLAFARTQKRMTTPTLGSNLQLIGSIVMLVIIGLGVVLPSTSLLLQSTFLAPSPIKDIIESSSVIVNTLWISIIGGGLFSLSGLVGLCYKRLPLLRYLLLSLFALPAVTYGIVGIKLFNSPAFDALYASPIALLLLYTLRFVPISAEIFLARSKQIPQNEMRSAQLYVGSMLLKITKILLPYYVPAFLTSFGVGLWLIATELPITLLVQPPGFQTITSRLFILLHYGSESLMNSLTLVLLFITVVPFIVISTLGKKNVHD